ncbi:MAG: type I glyceraldehyde-3-phosphate dehydrogenase [Nautiliaceae bacterium]|jgi:glyceraldehyde 3-phosphate dehydrogenase
MKKVAINGLGRIGKMVLWHYFTNKPDNIEIIVANGGSGTPEDLAYMLKFDSVHGRFPVNVEYTDDSLILDGQEIKIVNERDPQKLPWSEMGIDIVIEATGKFTEKEKASKHLQAGAKKVVITAPGKNVDKTIVLGVNENEYDPQNHHIVSNASCTTNSLAPVMKILEDEYGVESALVTTVHAYTSSQVTIDKKKPGKHRRGRAAAINIIPTTTGAAKATIEVIPQLKGKMHAMALRVPVADVAVTDINVTLKKEVSAEELNKKFEEYANGKLKGILGITYDEVVSTDMINNPNSSTIDALSTAVVDGNKAKILTWYDNEFGYAKRVLELTSLIASKL